MDKFLWNQFDIEPPPSMCTVLETPIPAKLRKQLNLMCNDARELLLSKIFRQEATYISRTLYRYKNQFRCLKGFAYLRKINQALLRVPKLNLREVFKEFNSSLSKEYIPSTPMIQFTMLRMQSLGFLLARLICTCEEVFIILKMYMNMPGPWDIYLTFQACISRIWVLSHHLLQNIDRWYEALSQLLALSDKGISWLPPSYCLPENLLSWINQQLVENNLSPIITVNAYKSTPDNLPSVETILSMKAAPSKTSIDQIQASAVFSSKSKKGKKRRRDKPMKKCKKLSSESTDIHSLDHLKRFLDTEVSLRCDSMLVKDCVTRNLDPVEWDILKTILMKSIEKINKKPGSSDKILSKVRQTLQVAIS